MGLVRSFIGTDGIWQYIPHINTGLFSIIKVHFLLFANLIVDWHINTINFTDSGFINLYTIRAALIKAFSALGLRRKTANSLAYRNLL